MTGWKHDLMWWLRKSRNRQKWNQFEFFREVFGVQAIKILYCTIFVHLFELASITSWYWRKKAKEKKWRCNYLVVSNRWKILRNFSNLFILFRTDGFSWWSFLVFRIWTARSRFSQFEITQNQESKSQEAGRLRRNQRNCKSLAESKNHSCVYMYGAVY